MPGLDMLVKFGYCLICDNGPIKINREYESWIENLIKTGEATTPIVKECTHCGTQPPNKNLLYIEVDIPKLG